MPPLQFDVIYPPLSSKHLIEGQMVWYNTHSSLRRGLIRKTNMPDIIPVPFPSSSVRDTTPLTAVTADEESIIALIDQLLNRSGLSQRELSKRIGIDERNLSQYRHFRRRRPSVWWLARLATACGARLWIEWPTRPLA